MEKKLQYDAPEKTFPGAVKILLKMKLTLCVILFSFLGGIASESYSQTTKLSLDLKNTKVKDALETIENQSEFFFVYSEKLIDVDREINIEVRGSTIEKILDKIFKDTNVNYTVKGTQIVLATPEANNEIISSSESQQQNRLTGKATDSSGAPLPGVSVVVKGTTTGVITDNSGLYSLANIPENATLQFSFIGMKSQEIPVGNQSVINVVLTEEAIGINEVMVVGYGTMRKKDLTGAITKVNMDTKSTIPNTSVIQALQGSIAGLNVGMTTGAGSEPGYSIRGTHSLSAGGTPLIVVDGAIYNGRLSDFSPGDILSVDVLKDASSAAVYGSRAANGVMLLTTKMGTTTKPQFRFSSYAGVNIASRMPEMNGPKERIQTLIDVAQANGNPNPVIENLFFDSFELENYKKGITTNLDDIFIKTGVVQNYELSYSGKTKATSYFVSGNYLKQKGVVSADSYKRYGLRINLENNITDWLKLGIKSNFTTNDYSGVGISHIEFGFVSPYSRLYDDNGKEIRYIVGDRMFSNPLEKNRIQDLDMSYSLLGITYAELSAPFLKGLKYKINFSQNKRWTDQANFYGFDTYTGIDKKGYGTRTKNDGYSYMLDNIVSYDNNIGKHYINATLLYSREHSEISNFSGTSTEFGNDLLGYNYLSAGKTQTIATSASDNNSLSQMARLQYVYDDKYLANFTIRRDGYSAFGNNTKFGVFPSAGIAYVVSNEDFMKRFGFIDNLKFRLSYGKNGNQAIGSYSTLARVGFSKYWDGQGTATTQYVSSMANADLGWETSAVVNFGLDFSVLRNHLSGTIDYYKTKSTDLLLTKLISDMTGFGSIWANIGEMKNNGLEITLNSINIKKPNFLWTSDLVFSRSRDQITHLYGTDANKDGKEDDDKQNRWFIGEPVGLFYGYQKVGVWQLTDQQAGTIPAGYKPGDFRIKDVNSDGKIDQKDAEEIFAYSSPNFRVSLSNNFKYKKLSLSVMLNSVWGGNGYYMGNNSLNAQGTSSFLWSPDRANIPKIPYWTPTNPSTEYPSVNYSNPFNVSYLKDRTFIRLQDVSLSYDLGNYIKGLSSCRAYVSGKNLYVWTKDWFGYDPETGIGIGGVPSMSTFVFGVEIAF